MPILPSDPVPTTPSPRRPPRETMMGRSSPHPHPHAFSDQAGAGANADATETPPSQQRTSLSQYPKYKISQLSHGPLRACISGLLVNLQSHVPNHDVGGGVTNGNRNGKARSCIKMILKDETGEILVNLLVLDTRYKLLLNTIVTVWTTYVCLSSSTSGYTSASTSSSSSFSVAPVSVPSHYLRSPHPALPPPRNRAGTTALAAPLSTSLFPEGNVACGLRIFGPDATSFLPGDDGLWDRVAGCVDRGKIVSLKEFGCGSLTEDDDATLLVSVISVGKLAKAARTEINHASSAIGLDVVDISTMQSPMKIVFENPLRESVSGCEGSILLITCPRLLEGRLIVLSHNSRILIDPDIEPARRLKKAVLQRFSPSCNAHLDEEYFDHLFSYTVAPRMTTLLAFGSLISQTPAQPRRALVSVILRHANVLKLARTSSLFCMPCPKCLRPIYSNRSPENCPATDCDTLVHLRLNPWILGGLGDETAGALYTEAETKSRDETVAPGGKRVHDTHDEQFVHQGLPALLLADQACTSLLGITPSAIEEKVNSTVIKNGSSRLNRNLDTWPGVEDYLRNVETQVAWARKTMLLVWTGDLSAEDYGQGQNGEKVGGSWDHSFPEMRMQLQRRMVIMDVF